MGDQIFSWVQKIIFTIFFIWLICILISKIFVEKGEDEIKSSCYWTNIDPNISVQHIVDYDIENRKVIYDDGGSYDKPLINKGKSYIKSSGITIRSGNTVIQTDVSPEELLESIDIDYNDIIDYYGVELR